MTREEYLTEHHHITESLIGLVSIQVNIEGVSKVLSELRPKLKELQKQRYLTLCEGMSKEDIKNIMIINGFQNDQL